MAKKDLLWQDRFFDKADAIGAWSANAAREPRWEPRSDTDREIAHEVRRALEGWQHRRYVSLERTPDGYDSYVTFNSIELLTAFVAETVGTMLEDQYQQGLKEGYDEGYGECMSDNYLGEDDEHHSTSS